MEKTMVLSEMLPEYVSLNTDALKAEFREEVIADLQTAMDLCEESAFDGASGGMVGVEQEVQFVGRTGEPANVAETVATQLNDPRYQLEFSKFTFEIALPPDKFEGEVLSRLKRNLSGGFGEVKRAAKRVSAQPSLLALLPSLKPDHIIPDALTSSNRYLLLHAARQQNRGPGYEYSIEGLDRLALRDDDILLAGAFTSLQLHWETAPSTAAAEYNWAQAIAAPCLAACASSPLLFGHRLWHETRIPLFEQTSNLQCRHVDPFRPTRPRASLGKDWIKHATEVWREDIADHEPIIGLPVRREPQDQGARTDLRYLRSFNSTVYRWNRLCCNAGGGAAPVLHIEARMLPSGPTLADQMANAALWFGLMAAGTTSGPEIVRSLTFNQVRENFRRAARDSLECQFHWVGGSTLPAAQLLRETLIPLALTGLQAYGISDAERWLSPLVRRVEQVRSPSRWILNTFDLLSDELGPARAGINLTRRLIEFEEQDIPVCDWPVVSAQTEDARKITGHARPNEAIANRAPATWAPAENANSASSLNAFGRCITLRRKLFHNDSGKPGPLLVMLAGLHGNELNGLATAQIIAEELVPETGAVVGLLGNLTALARRVRYIDEDLNRAFRGDQRPDHTIEQSEARMLWNELASLMDQYPGSPAWLLDLHGTSGHSPPYLSLLGDVSAWPLMDRFPLAHIVGFEDVFKGTLVEAAAHKGWKAATLEAGALSAPVSIMNGVSILKLLGHELNIARMHEGASASLVSGLAAQSTALGTYRFAYNHFITPEDQFQMLPGFVSFQPVRKNEVLAADRKGPVTSPLDGLLLMPLYQAQGQNGFFIIQEASGEPGKD